MTQARKSILVGFLISVGILVSPGIFSTLIILQMIDPGQLGEHALQISYKTKAVRKSAIDFQAAESGSIKTCRDTISSYPINPIP